MAGYSPLKITGMQSGLVQEREEFLLPDDAYPVLQNAYVWRERILRKKGYQLLGRLQRTIGTTNGSGNLIVTITPNPIANGIAFFVVGTDTFTDKGGANPTTLLTNGSAGGVLNRTTGLLTILGSQPTTPVQYFPGLPVMGIRIREMQNSATDQTLFFDQDYCYRYNDFLGQFQEFIPGTTWNAHNGDATAIDFFWSTNYWVSDGINFGSTNFKLFWVTNNTGQFGALADPIRITDGTTWLNFSPPTYGQIDATNYLVQCLAFLPYRGRLVTVNTWEGPSYSSATNYSNRIRWSTIGNPFIPFAAGPPSTGSWRDDIRGQGGFLDIPTSEDIVSIGFVRDNMVVYCERSTWQLRYTGRSIAPFQIERVNSELGVEGTFSAIQFDTSLVGIGDKGIIECDSYKSERIDIKIPDLVFHFNGLTNSTARVQGIRDFINRLAYWTFCDDATESVFPNQRLVYNYENDSWATFNDSLTALGTYQPQSGRTWLNTPVPWIKCEFNWINQPEGDPEIVAGNQQGFIEYLDELTTNDVSLYISNIDNTGNPTLVTSPNHNMQTGFVIEISGIPTGSPFSDLNGGVFSIYLFPGSSNTFILFSYNPISGQFDIPYNGTLDPTMVYQGGGLIAIRDNFSIKSKKFNFLDEGKNIQLGYLDILMEATGPDNPGAISLNVYLDYNDSTVSNTIPQNDINDGEIEPTPDLFFNSIIPTTGPTQNTIGGTKFWQRVYCATRASFLTLEYTFNNAQMAGVEQQLDVQIDAQVLWIRQAGRMTSI